MSRNRRRRGLGPARLTGDVGSYEIEASDVDVDLIEPRSGWEGSRGARPTFGRLYRGSGDFRLERAEQGDRDVLLGRSASSGYRGGRPFFGADDDPPFNWESEIKMGPLEYRGPQIGSIALGLAVAVLMWKAAIDR